MNIVGKATAVYRIKEPEQLKLFYGWLGREKYQLDMKRLYKSWKMAKENGKEGDMRVMLEVDYRAGIYVYEGGQKYRLCSLNLAMAQEAAMKMIRGIL